MKAKRPLSATEKARLQAELRHDVAVRQQSYRARALALFGHVCARCGREFEGRRLRELTVHHRDHDFKNNPPDGSNWELLCLYCHDHEHEKFKIAGTSAAGDAPGASVSPFTSPFADLDRLLPRPSPVNTPVCDRQSGGSDPGPTPNTPATDR